MPAKTALNIDLSVSHFKRRVVALNSRYRWNCWDRGKNPFVILQWTHSGKGILESSEGRFEMPADHAFIALVPERSVYYYPRGGHEPWIFSWLNFPSALACHLFRELRVKFGPVIPLQSRGAAGASLRRLLAKDQRTETWDRFQTSLQVYAFILEWWKEASQPTGSAEDRLVRALHFGREHFREPLGVKELAKEAGMSREHFSRVFSDWAGESPSDCLRRLRLEEATRLIGESDLTLREVAMRSGFYSDRHLMRVFQRVHGVSPSQYRRGVGRGRRLRRRGADV